MKHPIRDSTLDAPLLLFLLSALLGVWSAYDRIAALERFAVLVVAVGLYFLLTWHVRQVHRSASALPPRGMVVLVVCSVAMTVIWMITFAMAPQRGSNAHTLAAVTEMILPFAGTLIVYLARRNEIQRALAVLSFAVFLIAGLAFAGAFSTLLCLGIVSIAAGCIALFSRSRFVSFLLSPQVWLAFALAILAFASIANWNFAELESVAARVALFFSQNDFPRSELFANILYLLRDYAFTGGGLGNFPMVYAIYGQLLHVYYFPHAHNIFLQVWMEQGLVGLLAWAWLLFAFYARLWQQRAHLNWLAAGAVASVSATLLHGMWDAPLYYADWTLVLGFVPMGMAMGAMPPVVREQSHHHKRNTLLAAGALVAVGVTALLNRSTLGGMWFANMGSLTQTQIELGAYQFPARAIPIVRRTTDETQARTSFETALQWDANNVTALQRLGMLAFAHGEYDKAQTYLEKALPRAPEDWRTWQLLGDVYLAQGRDEDAYALWSRVRDAPSKLEVEATLLYDRTGDSLRAARARELARRIRLQIKPK